jgi:hypothetical protein
LVYVTGTSEQGCAVVDSFHITARSCDTVSAINNVADDNNITVYPNPASNNFFIRIQTPLPADGKADLFTTEGKLVWMRYVKEGETMIEADCSMLAAGVYLLRVNYSGINTYHKIVVDR